MTDVDWGTACSKHVPPFPEFGMQYAVLKIGTALTSSFIATPELQEEIVAAGAAIQAVMAELPPANMLWQNMQTGPSGQDEDALWIALEWIVSAWMNHQDDPPVQHFYLMCADVMLASWWHGRKRNRDRR